MGYGRPRLVKMWNLKTLSFKLTSDMPYIINFSIFFNTLESFSDFSLKRTTLGSQVGRPTKTITPHSAEGLWPHQRRVSSSPHKLVCVFNAKISHTSNHQSLTFLSLPNWFSFPRQSNTTFDLTRELGISSWQLLCINTKYVPSLWCYFSKLQYGTCVHVSQSVRTILNSKIFMICCPSVLSKRSLCHSSRTDFSAHFLSLVFNALKIFELSL